MLEGLAQQWRQRGGVHRHLGGRAVCADERRHGANVDDLPRGVGRGLDPDQTHAAAGRRPLPEHGLEVCEVRVLLHLRAAGRAQWGVSSHAPWASGSTGERLQAN